MSAYFFQLYVHLLPAFNCVPSKTSCHGAWGVTLAFRERSLGPELKNQIFCRKNACPQPGCNAPAASGCHPFRDSKTHWFWSSSLQVYRVWPDQKRHEHPAKSNMKTALEERSNLGQPFTAWNQNRWDHLALTLHCRFPVVSQHHSLYPNSKPFVVGI